MAMHVDGEKSGDWALGLWTYRLPTISLKAEARLQSCGESVEFEFRNALPLRTFLSAVYFWIGNIDHQLFPSVDEADSPEVRKLAALRRGG